MQMIGSHRFAAFCAAVVLGVGLAACAGPSPRADSSADAVADRARAERLDALFQQLETAVTVAQGRALEAQIWQLWTRTGKLPVDTMMVQGMDAMARGDLLAAYRVFKAVTQMTPDFAEGWNKLATVEYLLGHYDQSRRDIGKVLELEPRHFGALSGLGLVYSAIGNEERALAAFRAALQIHPTMPGLRDRATRLQRRLQGRQI